MTEAGRRTVLAAGLAGLAGLVTAGCGRYGDSGADEPAPQPSRASSAPAGTDSTGTGTGARDAIASTSDVPLGGGTVLADRKLVLTQPTRGDFKAFSAVCTHQGCMVEDVAQGTINCPCHGSRFAIADGTPTAGPAGQRLPAQAISVEGTTIRLA